MKIPFFSVGKSCTVCVVALLILVTGYFVAPQTLYALKGGIEKQDIDSRTNSGDSMNGFYLLYRGTAPVGSPIYLWDFNLPDGTHCVAIAANGQNGVGIVCDWVRKEKKD